MEERLHADAEGLVVLVDEGPVRGLASAPGAAGAIAFELPSVSALAPVSHETQCLRVNSVAVVMMDAPVNWGEWGNLASTFIVAGSRQ